MRLIFVINVFNEARFIEKCISSIHDIADEVWVYDGAYKQYPHMSPMSSDGTLNIVKKFPKVKLVTRTTVWDSQIQKRTEMFKDGREGDLFFKLDGDEYVTNPEIIRSHLEDLDVGWVWTVSNLYPEPIMTARIFKYQEGMHYAGRHHWLYNGKKEFITSDQHMNPKFRHQATPIRLFNFRDSSNTKRIPQKTRFLTLRGPDEFKYKTELDVYGKECHLIAHPHKAGRPVREVAIVREAVNPHYTFSLMISRPWAVDRYIACLKGLELPQSLEAVVVIDSKNDEMRRKITQYFTKDTRFEGVKIHFTGNNPLPEFSSVRFRRQRIVDNWHTIITEMRGSVLLASEDDSLPQKDAYIRLINDLRDTNADFIQANIIGRWQAKVCPAWQIAEKDGAPILVWNAKEQSTGLQEIQGCGWYCFAARADAMRKYQMYVDDTIPLGPDLRFGYMLWKGGFKLMHDWGIKVEHFGTDFSLYPGRDRTEQKMWRKRMKHWDPIPYDEKLAKYIIEGKHE